MKRILALLPVAALAGFSLSGCGAAGCSSSPATIGTPSGATCSVAAGSTITFNVTICSKCTDTSPGCQAEFLTDHIELQPTVQQCTDQSGCSTQGCSTNPTVACNVSNIPANAVGYPIQIVGDTTVQATLTFAGTGSSCTL